MMSASRQLPPSTGPRRTFDVRQALERPVPLVMGILNLTPDSFSDGGRFDVPDRALAQARRMIAEGADLIDVGAESTRPYTGAKPVTAKTELERLAPVLSDIIALGVPVSIDTMKAEVADWAFARGAVVANDVWGLQRDPGMAEVVARHGVPVVVMHNRQTVEPAIDILADMIGFFHRSLDIADRFGIPQSRIVLDPGIGFGKTPEQSMTALANLAKLRSLGCPILVGASRKRFIDAIVPSPPDRRLGGSIAAHLVAARNGASIIRTHDVAETRQALMVAAAIEDTR